MRKIAMATLIFASVGATNAAWADKACFDVQGMTCATCGLTLKSAVKKLNGIQDVRASVEKKTAIVRFEPKQTNVEAIQGAIDNVGYKATPKECKKIEG